MATSKAPKGPAMTSREKVLSVYPSAVCNVWGGWRDGEMGFTVRRRQMSYEEKHRDSALGTGESETEAWDDAASKLPPGSPAGETASGPKCPYCNVPMKSGDGSYWCMNKKCAEQLYPSGEHYAVPEPVPTEGAVPPVFNKDRQLVDEVSKLPFSRRYAIYRNIKKTVICTPSAPEAAAANQCDGCALGLPVDNKGNHLREGAVFGIHMSCTKHKYAAAPIAPAAEELVEELVTALRGLRNFCDTYVRWVDAQPLIDSADDALVRAEEYRKGAKNDTHPQA